MKTDAIIFDKDGTLIDFDAFWVPVSIKAIGFILDRLGIDRTPCDEILEAFGVHEGITSINGVLCKGTYEQMGQIVYGILCKHGYHGSSDEVIRILVEAYNESTDAGLVKPTCKDLAESLTELKGMGKRLAVVTTDNSEITLKCLKVLGILELFDKIYTDDGINPTKPDPFCVYDFCERFGIEKGGVVMVGDTMTDVKFAKNAGISVIGLAKADINRDILIGEADAVISEISQLSGIID